MLPHGSTGLLELHLKQQQKQPSMTESKSYKQAIPRSARSVVNTSTAQQDAQSPVAAAQQALIHHP